LLFWKIIDLINHQTANGKALQLLQAFLEDIKKPARRGSIRKYELEFYIKQETEDEKSKKTTFKKVSLSLSLDGAARTTRGDHLISQLAPLFQLCGLSEKAAEVSLSGYFGGRKKKPVKPNNKNIDFDGPMSYKEGWRPQDDWDEKPQSSKTSRRRGPTREEEERGEPAWYETDGDHGRDSWKAEEATRTSGGDKENKERSERKEGTSTDEDGDDDEDENIYEGDEDDEMFYTIDHVRHFLLANTQTAKNRQQYIRQVERETGLHRYLFLFLFIPF